MTVETTSGADLASSSFELTPEVLAELERLHTAATQGPWRHKHGRIEGGRSLPSGDASEMCFISASTGRAWDCRTSDGDLIAELRNHAPTLIAAARRQLALDALTGDLVQPSGAEQAAWPDATRNYVQGLWTLAGIAVDDGEGIAEDYAATLRQIQSLLLSPAALRPETIEAVGSLVAERLHKLEATIHD